MNERPNRKIACPILGCSGQRKRGHVMCPRHWFTVEPDLRERIWNLFKTRRGSPEHLRAIAEAIEQVNQQASSASPTCPAA